MRPFILPVSLAGLAACSDTDHPHEHNEGEVITTVVLTFTPDGGGDAVAFTWSDPENDGDPDVDAIDLAVGAAWDVRVSLWNELADPAVDLTAEIEAEAEDHQVFFTGSAISGPASTSGGAFLTHAYADVDGDGNPIGLVNSLVVDAAGEGEIVVTLRHMPPEDGAPVKTATAAADVAAGGFDTIGGDNDAQVTFPVSAAL